MTDDSATAPRAASPRRARKPRGLAQKLGSIILAFEAIVVGLAGLTVYGLKALGPDIEPWWGIVGGAVVGVAMLVAAGLMGSRAGIVMGWILQVIVLLSAILVPAILLVAIVFGGMWAYAMIVGGRADRAAASARLAHPTTPTSSTDTAGKTTESD
ncbi:DUF4233 domain-containing protein [Microbacterium sp. 22303]|uniref:DUF4233 domain-containing protein n=1 Tax=Microbacterium sp. 22303 TaxID=3453905 RepID=UPI003F83A82C